MSCGPLWRGPGADRREEGALRDPVTASFLGEGEREVRGGEEEEKRGRSEGRQGERRRGGGGDQMDRRLHPPLLDTP